MTKADIQQEFGTCETCKWLYPHPTNPQLKVCGGGINIGIVGPKFFCANYEKGK